MNIDIFLDSKLFVAIASATAGILAAIITQIWLNKRAVFTYNVFHNQVGQTADDAIYGSVQVTWNDNPVSRLYLSTIELINESSKDFESVAIRVYTNNTKLLSQRVHLTGTTRNIDFTDEYNSEISVPEDEQPTNAQTEIYRCRRDYIVPILNRSQKIRFEILNAANTEEQPEIWLEILQKGIDCKFRIAHQQFMGVPQPTAALVGTVVGLLATIILLLFVSNIWFAALSAFFIGVLVMVPGAYTIKIYRKTRRWFTG